MIQEQLQFDDGRYDRARIGFILLDTEQTVDGDLSLIQPEGVGYFITRVPTIPEITPDALLDLANHVPGACKLMLPDTEPDVICFTCSSGAMAIGDTQAEDLMKDARPIPRMITASASALRALTRLRAQKVSVITPYPDDVNQNVARYMADNGFEVTGIQGFDLLTDAQIIRVTPNSIKDIALSVDHGDADAVFLCCGALRAMDVAQAVEDALGRPVITSNQAMIWDCLRQAGVTDKIEGYGQLLTL